MLCTLINPSDDYTFEAIDEEVAFPTAGYLGNGFGVVCGEGVSYGPFLLCDAAEIFKETFGKDALETIKARRLDMAAAFDSFRCGNRTAYKFCKTEAERDELHDSFRTSMSDIGRHAWNLAAAFRRAAEKETW